MNESIVQPNGLLDVIHEDADLLVVNKPAGLVCHPTKDGPLSSLISRLRLYLGGEAFLINRLDRETSGVTLAAKNAEVSGQLGKLWEARVVQKKYRAIVHGFMPQDAGAIELPLGKDLQSQVAIKDCVRPDGAAARTDFFVERRFRRDERDFTLVRVAPQTGRKHQIRIHLAAIGHPLVGDKLYGGDEDLYLAFVQGRLTDGQRCRLMLANHALHAQSLAFMWREEPRLYTAPPDNAFAAFLQRSREGEPEPREL